MINMRDRIRTGLLSRGMPDHVADAFIMNFQDESGLNPGINEIAPTVPGSRGGFGLYQLTGPRRKAYEQYAQQRGVAPDNVDAQLDFMMTELQGPESRAAKSIFSAPDTGTAAAAIVNDFLRPAEQHRAARVARYTGGNTMRQPTMSTQGQAPNPRDEVAQMFPQMPSSSLDKIAMALMSMSAFPTQGMQMQMADIKERQGETREQNQTNARKNKTVEVLQQRAQNGDPQAQRGIEVLKAGGSVQDAISVAFRQNNDPNVQSSVALPDNSGTVLTMRDGNVKVVTAGGDELTGEKATEFVRNAQESYTQNQRSIYGARREGTLGADIELGGEAARVTEEGKQAPAVAREYLNEARNVGSTIRNYDSAIRAIDDGAQSGVVYNMLPNITKASASLQNAKSRLGLDVIGSVTFGALSEGEMRLAMDTAVPQDLGPKELRQWLVEKKAAQQKMHAALTEAAYHFASGGSMEEYVEMYKGQGSAQQPTQNSTGSKRLRFNPETGDFE